MSRTTRRRQGGIAVLQVALVMPVVLFIITAVVQVATWQHAVHIAQSAAARGVETARVRGGTDASGAAAARETAAQFSALQSPSIQISRSIDSVEVDLSATTPSIVPGISIPIHVTASGPVEPVP